MEGLASLHAIRAGRGGSGSGDGDAERSVWVKETHGRQTGCQWATQ